MMEDAKKIPLPNREEKSRKEIPFEERRDVWEKAREEAISLEKKELQKKRISPEDEETIKRQIIKEIEMMELTPELQDEAVQKAKKIEFLGEKEKLEHLLKIAKERGVEFAVKVAENMNDHYVLDIFHDILVKEGFYKKFLRK